MKENAKKNVSTKVYIMRFSKLEKYISSNDCQKIRIMLIIMLMLPMTMAIQGTGVKLR